MKKLFTTAMALMILLTSTAQKKWNQYSFRVGYDKATKNNYPMYANGNLNGLNIGASFDKFWSWYGVGVDADFYYNQAPSYLKETALIDSIRNKSGGFFQHNTHYTISKNQKALTRGFIGIGPSFKFQNPKNNFVVELNTRAGLSYSNGGMIEYATLAKAPFNNTWFTSMLTRNGAFLPGRYGWTFRDGGYNNDLITTVKLQLRANYYIKRNLGINIGGYYNHFEGSKTKVDYVDFSMPGQSYWNYPTPIKSQLSALSSYGVNLGVTYRMVKDKAPVAKTAKVQSSAAINVNDELTGQPIRNAEVTITSNIGKTYTATTNDAGVATFEKIENGNYTAKGILNGIATTDANFSVAKSKGIATLIHNDPRFTVIGKAVNASNNQPEAGVIVNLKNDDKGSVKMSTSQGTTGNFSFQIESNSDYTLTGKKDSYISNIEKISTKGLTRSQTLYVELAIGVEKVEKGKALTLNNIYYDLDKANIREDASSDLQKVITFLLDNPSFNVEIASHTDNRGSDEYNQKLSQQRAQAVVDYLAGHGISASRLKATGYGESKLKNNCTECTEAQHQQNRRTELTVVN